MDLLSRIERLDLPGTASLRSRGPVSRLGVEVSSILSAIGIADENLPARGTSIIIITASLARAPNNTQPISELRDVTREVHIDLLKANLDPDHESTLAELLATGFVVDTVPVPGDLWRDRPWLVDYRNRMLREWVEWATRTRSNAADALQAQVFEDGAVPGSDCRACHVEEWEAWRNDDPHGHAWQALQDAPNEASRNPFCVPCHTTGLTTADIIREPGLPPRVRSWQRDVSCRSCHKADANEASPCAMSCSTVEQVCASCHSSGRGSPRKSALGCCAINGD